MSYWQLHILALTALDWVYNADEGNPLQDEKLTQRNLDQFLWLALENSPRFYVKSGENLRDVIMTRELQMPQIKVDSLKKKNATQRIKPHSGKEWESHSPCQKTIWLSLLSQKIFKVEIDGVRLDLNFWSRTLGSPQTSEVHSIDPWATTTLL